MQEMGISILAKWVCTLLNGFFVFQTIFATFLALEFQRWLKQNHVHKAAVLLISGETERAQEEIKASALYICDTTMVRD